MMNGKRERWDSRTATWVPLGPLAEIAGPAPTRAAGVVADPALIALRSQAAPLRKAGRMSYRTYHAARGGRLGGGAFSSSTTSADQEIHGSLQRLRNGSRALMRDAAYAKRARKLVMDNVVGVGIGLQAQVKKPRGALDEPLNAAIEEAWLRWSRADCCHTGGELDMADLERLAMGETVEAGEILVRKHYRRVGRSRVPLALEVIEPERLAEEHMAPANAAGNEVRMGVEIDKDHRKVAYYVRERHPGDIRSSAYSTDRVVRVPAEDMLHLYIVDRWPQTRGVPWLHAVALRLNDMDGYSEAEIIAARGAASYMAFIKTPDNSPIPVDEQDEDGDERVITMKAGIVEQLPPGWDIEINNPNRPNPNMDPFMRLMLREVAAGANVSYESLSRDYAQGNYSNSRLSLLDDRDNWRVLQKWFVRRFRQQVHEAFMQQAVLAGEIPGLSSAQYFLDPDRYNAARYRVRGWSWIDPTKEVAAFKEAVRCGFMTVADVIAATSPDRDIEDVIDGRALELKAMHEKGLVFDTDPEFQPNPQPEAPKAAADDDEGGGAAGDDDDTKAGKRLRQLREVNYG